MRSNFSFNSFLSTFDVKFAFCKKLMRQLRTFAEDAKTIVFWRRLQLVILIHPSNNKSFTESWTRRFQFGRNLSTLCRCSMPVQTVGIVSSLCSFNSWIMDWMRDLKCRQFPPEMASAPVDLSLRNPTQSSMLFHWKPWSELRFNSLNAVRTETYS